MAELALNAEVRKTTGKESAKKVRASSQVPAVVYGKGFNPVHCALAKAEVDKVLRRANRNALINLNLDGETKVVIVRDKQQHPISHEFSHIDFQAVQMEYPIKVDVDLEFVGTPIGKKNGGIFTSLCKQVRVETLPAKIPDVIKLDISSLDCGDSLHVSDIATGDFKIITKSKIALCQVSEIKEEEEATTAAAETTEAAAGGTPAAASAAAAPAAAASAAAPAADKKAK